MTRIKKTKGYLCLLLLLAVLCTGGNLLGNDREDTSDGIPRLIDIYTEFFINAGHKEAIDDLSKLIFSETRSFDAVCLKDTVLHMIRTSYGTVLDSALCEDLIFYILSDKNIPVVEGYFDKPELIKLVKTAIIRWNRPKYMKIRPEHKSVKVGSSVEYEITIYNERHIILSNVDLDGVVKPDDIGTYSCDNKRLTFTGLNPGQAKIVISTNGYESNISRSMDIQVTATKKPPKIFEVWPGQAAVGGKILVFGENLQSSQGRTEIHFNNARTYPDSASSNRLVVTVPRQVQSGPVAVRTPEGVDTSSMYLYINRLPDPPDARLPLIASGATVLSGIAFLVLDKRSIDKFNEYANDPRHPQDMYDSYLSANRLRRVSVVLTTLGAVTTGYLWYNYIKRNNKYKNLKKDNFLTFDIDSGGNSVGLIITYNF